MSFHRVLLPAAAMLVATGVAAGCGGIGTSEPVATTKVSTQPALLATAAVFAGLIASYALVTTTGFAVLHAEPEAVDGLALFTKAVEVVGLVLAASLLRRPSLALTLTQPKGTLT